MNLCKDCQNFRPYRVKILWWSVPGPADLSRCAAFPDPVTGEAKKFCDLEREFGQECGREGKLFKQATVDRSGA